VATESLIQDFQGNLINVGVGAQELFIHNYIPNYGGLEAFDTVADTISLPDGTSVELRDGLYFNILRYSTESITDSTVMVYESIEEEEPIVDTYDFFDLTDADRSAMSLQLSQNEKEIISYRKPVTFYFSVDEEPVAARGDYVNSIQAREMDFDIVSSLGSITTEDVAIESTTVGEAISLTSTTETITDVGGPTATGTRTNIKSDGTRTRDVTIGSY
tara:strand:- start:6534 stop:7184 length:651 start_codon:yes stop_codon:yes gene_type:complete